MKNFFIEYRKIITYTVIGFIFSFASFLLFLNLYHMREVNTSYVVRTEDIEVLEKIENEKTEIKNNLDIDFTSYVGSDKEDIVLFRSKISNCLQSIDTLEIENVFLERNITYRNLYHSMKLYENQVINSCFVLELSDLDQLNINGLNDSVPFINDLMENIQNRLLFLEQYLKNNTTYFFGSDTFKNQVFHGIRDPYYQLMGTYQDSVTLLENLSLLYKNSVGENYE